MSTLFYVIPFLGSSTVDREDIPANLVKDIRNYFQISPEYFSMLLVGKDGNVKSWYPSPMWSMAIVYDLIDSMQLRRQEMTIQQSLGMQCPDDEYGGYGYHSYHQGYQEGYQDDYRHHGSYHHGYPYWKEQLSLWPPRACLLIAIQAIGGQLLKVFPGHLDIHASSFHCSVKGLWSFAFSKMQKPLQWSNSNQ